jgi:tRNA (uracil-5-)-methyltransferase TRM9
MAEKKVYHRYYHLFVKGELEELVVEAAKEDGFEILDAQPLQSESSSTDKWMRITGVGYEADNWWIQAEVGLR